MTTFVKGDRVTVAGAPGEWTVHRVFPNDMYQETTFEVRRSINGMVDRWHTMMYLLPSMLTLVEPPLPPEPPVGTVGMWHGMGMHRGSHRWQSGGGYYVWSEIAADFIEYAPKAEHRSEVIEEVAAWLDSRVYQASAQSIREHFGVTE